MIDPPEVVRSKTSRVVILNGKVAEDDDISDALSALRTEGPIDIRVTRGPGDARRFARDAADAGADEVYVVGGDGTLNEAVAGLVSRPADDPRHFVGVMGIVPAGTANDFASSAGIPTESPLAAVEALNSFHAASIDLGWVSGGAEGPFLNVATAGFGAEASTDASKELKAILGKVAYLVTGITRLGSRDGAPREVWIRAPDFERRIAFHMLAVGNGRCAGGGMPVCPDANVADGLFDVTIVPVGQVGDAVTEAIRHGLEGVGDAGIRFRAPWVELEAEEALQVNLDGEPASARRFRFDVRSALLRVLLPDDSPLL